MSMTQPRSVLGHLPDLLRHGGGTCRNRSFQRASLNAGVRHPPLTVDAVELLLFD